MRSAILDDLPKAFSLPAGEVEGKEIPLLPDRVIREVVTNAVMHRDYRVHGSIQIIRYSNRLEVRNPGYSIMAEERLGQPGSETRNPKIAAVLHDVNFAETKGSGIRVMRELMDEQGLSSPVLQSDRTGNGFMAMLLFHHFLSQDDLAWLKSLLSTALLNRIAGTGRKADKTALLQLVVDILAERPLSAVDLAQLLGRTQKHVRSEYLQPLMDQGRVVRSNPEKLTDPNQTYMAATGREVAE